jgi:hypothetical protein
MTPTESGFEQHEDAQSRAWAKLSALERLRWLQQAKEFSRRFLGAASKVAARKRSE